MKSKDVQILNKLKRIEKSLDAIESGKFSEFDIYQCCEYIGWLAKWKKVPKSVWEPLCNRATEIMNSGVV